MPQRLAKTNKHRAKKTKKNGVKGKRARENKGTTTSVPLTGDFPSLKFGKKVKPESILVPKSAAK